MWLLTVKMMRNLLSILLLALLTTGVVVSCKKWQDPAPTDDSRLTNPYCNDPSAVNYNWGFPGKPDNSVCYYPSDLFAGTYSFKDTSYQAATDLYLSADSFIIYISKISQTKISIDGMCPSGQKLILTAGATYTATVDTTVGDSTTLYPGQYFCSEKDTVVGFFVRDKVDSSLIYVDLYIRTDTGATVRRGRAIKK
jgi:hypothetical protein